MVFGNNFLQTELMFFKENMEIQQTIEKELTYIGEAPINREETRLIRYLHRVKSWQIKVDANAYNYLKLTQKISTKHSMFTTFTFFQGALSSLLLF